MATPMAHDDWRTKPTDRFVLRWIKCHLSAPITRRLTQVSWLRPWMVTVAAATLGVVAGVLFAVGLAWAAGLAAVVSQVLDGVDGQLARLAGRESAAGAFLDSVLDRYGDWAMVLGTTVYCTRLAAPGTEWVVATLGFLALAGSGLISYTTARAEALDIPLGRPTLASKGTRIAAVAVGGMGSVLWSWFPLVILGYLAVHTNGVVLWRVARAWRIGRGGLGS